MILATFLASITLVTNGVSVSRIQLHRKASQVEVRAARELQGVLKEMSGAHVLYTMSPGSEYFGKPCIGAEIVLVTEQWGGNLLPKKALEKLAATTNPDAFVICSREDRGCGKGLCIAGKTPVGVYYGVYAFLEDYLGCGFYHAEKDGTVIPNAATIEVKRKGEGEGMELFDFREPWIRYRRMSCWSKPVEPLSLHDMFAWQAKRTFQWWLDGALRGKTDFPESALTFSQLANLPYNCGGEPFTCQAVPDELFDTHPEYFPLINGKRVRGKYPTRRCFTNRDVFELCKRLAIGFVDYGGEVAIQMTDTPSGWCECENCRKYGSDEKGAWSGENYAHRFCGELAAAVLAARPDADIVVDAYLHWRELPTCDFIHDDRVKCVYAPHQRCYVHALNDPKAACNRHFNELYRGWLGKYPRNGIFDYYCYAATEYAPIEYVFEADMKYYHANGLEHFVEDTSNGSIVCGYPYNNWQFYYIFSKMIWDPALSVEKEMDKVYRRYYGKAVEPMLKYHALRRELWETAPGHSYMGGSPHHALCLQRPGSQEKLDALLKEAEALAKGDRMLELRVGRDRRCFEGIWVKRWEDAQQKLANRGTVSVVRAPKGAIKVDGVLDDPVWRNAKAVEGLKTGKGEKPDFVTNFRVAEDGDNWYFAAEAFADAPRCKVTNRDGFLWEDDCVEFAVTTPKGDYYHFIVNANGALYDAYGMGVGFDYKGELKVVRTADRYVVELRAPVKEMEFDTVGAGGEWGVFFARGFQTDKPKSHKSANLFGGYAHNPLTYGKAAFE